MIEFDIPAYRRKFQSTFSVWTDLNKNKTFSCFVDSISDDGDIHYSSDGKYYNSNLNEMTPEYYPIPARWYRGGKSWYYISRKPVKTFNIGVNNESHNIFGFSQATQLDLIDRSFDSIETALYRGGAVDSNFFVTCYKDVLFRNKKIGSITGDYIKLDTKYKILSQEVSDVFKDFKVR